MRVCLGVVAVSASSVFVCVRFETVEVKRPQKLKACGSGPDLEPCPLFTHPTAQDTLKDKHQQTAGAAAGSIAK